MLPRFLLRGATALVLLTVGGTAALRLAGAPPAGSQPQTATRGGVSRELRFADLPDGGVAVLDASSNARVATLAPGSNGFLRGALRGLARERRRRGAAVDGPLRLVAWDDGDLTLQDPSIGITLDIGSFGSDNDRAFRRFLSNANAAP
jgi:putative photosynthetic complex assembly protein